MSDCRHGGRDVYEHPDMVHSPAHYTSGGIECIEAIRAQLTHEQYVGYLRGNIAKYMWRFERKGGVSDLRKGEEVPRMAD